MSLELATGWVIPAQDLSVKHARSSGPGGQNVNKVSTKVELRFHMAASVTLTDAQKQRLAKAFPSHVTSGGDFLVTSDRFRSQSRNLADALTRLTEMILSIRRPARKRIATKPSAGAKQRRLTDKRRQSERKRQRSSEG